MWGWEYSLPDILRFTLRLAPTRAPHHSIPPRATTFWGTAPPPGALDARAGWWARRDVVARGWVDGWWALVGARYEAVPKSVGERGLVVGTRACLCPCLRPGWALLTCLRI